MLSRLEHRANNARVESSNFSMVKLLQNRSFNRCRKERQGVGHCRNAKKNHGNSNSAHKDGHRACTVR